MKPPLSAEQKQLNENKEMNENLVYWSVEIDGQFDDDGVVKNERVTTQVVVRETQSDALVIVTWHGPFPVPGRAQHLLGRNQIHYSTKKLSILSSVLIKND